jgi:hypothetical protein
MGKRIIAGLGASYKTDDEMFVDVSRGDEVDLPPAEEKRLDEQGALVPKGRELDEYLQEKQDVYRADRGDSEASERLRASQRGGIKNLDAKVADPDALAERIKREQLAADPTVALAEDDPARAEVVLEAERKATDGHPRKGVEHSLKQIIEQE